MPDFFWVPMGLEPTTLPIAYRDALTIPIVIGRAMA